MARPRKIATVEELEQLCSDYFDDCDANKIPYTLGALAQACGFTAREDFKLQAERDDEFSATIKRAIGRVVGSMELRLLGGGNPAGAIFWLKNHGWSDRQEHQLSGPNNGPIQTDSKIEIVLRKA